MLWILYIIIYVYYIERQIDQVTKLLQSEFWQGKHTRVLMQALIQ